MKKNKNNLALIRNRFIFLCFILSSLIIVLLARSFYLQYIEADFLSTQGDRKHIKTFTIPSNRGTIYDRNQNPLAVSIPVENLVIDPKIFLATDRYIELTQSLSRILKMDYESIDIKIKERSSRRYFVLKRELDKQQINLIKKLRKSNYFWLEKDYKRFNPNGEVTTQLIGFNNNDDQGQEGLEYALNEFLSGQDGRKRTLTDSSLNTIRDIEVIHPAKQGQDFVSSIDIRIQYIAHSALYDGVKKYKGKTGSAVVLDIETGEVLAMVNDPSADMSDTKLRLPKFYKNRVATDKFEPGSTVKTLIIATALEHGIFNLSDTIDTIPFFIGSREIKDPRYYGPLNLGEILAKSSNVGVSRISLSRPSNKFILVRSYS